MPIKPVQFPKLTRSKYPKFKRYSHYRSVIREDCLERCVYCDLHEIELGGEKHMALDHFRPKDHYPELELQPENLVWSCIACNQLKGNDWPALGKDGSVDGRAGYMDPFAVDRSEYFRVQKDGTLKPRKDPGYYMIHILALNRPFLRYVRRRRVLAYQIRMSLEKHFRNEVETLEKVLAQPDLSDLERQRWTEELDYFKAWLETIEASDEVFGLR